MPISFKHEGDDREVIDASGRVITEAITAQTSAILGPSYTVRGKDWLGRSIIRTVHADIHIRRPNHGGRGSKVYRTVD